MSELEQAIAAWDGKATAAIEAVYARFSGRRDFAQRLVALAGRPACEKGATWLLEHHLEQGGALTPAVRRSLCHGLARLEGWEARLHVLQCLPRLTIGAREKKQVEAFVRECLGSDAKFVRAWAYGGFHELARQHPEYEAEASALLERGLRDEAASVRARIRRVLGS